VVSNSAVIYEAANSFMNLLNRYWNIHVSSTVEAGTEYVTFGNRGALNFPSRCDLGLVLKTAGPLYKDALILLASHLMRISLLSEMRKTEPSMGAKTDNERVIWNTAGLLGVREAISVYSSVIYSGQESGTSTADAILKLDGIRQILFAIEEILGFIDSMNLKGIWNESPLLDGNGLKRVCITEIIIFLCNGS
jgi:hypothetical protein